MKIKGVQNGTLRYMELSDLGINDHKKAEPQRFFAASIERAPWLAKIEY